MVAICQLCDSGSLCRVLYGRQVLSDLETFQLSDLWKTSQGRAGFWWRCHDAFVCNKCSPETAGHFFEVL